MKNYKILIISPNWIGDIIMSQTLFKLLKHNDPKILIDVMAPTWAHTLFRYMPEVNELVESNFCHGIFDFKKRYNLGKKISTLGYDQSIILPNSFKSALVPFFARIPKRTGWCGECRYGLLNDIRNMDKIRYPLMIERFMALALAKKSVLKQPYMLPKLKLNLVKRKNILKKFNIKINLGNQILALCPGAKFGSSKRWPAEYYAKVACKKLNLGWQVLIFGAASDFLQANKIQMYTKNRCINLVGETTLCEAINLISISNIVVTNDSGLMHVAAALELPLVAIYGSSSPEFTPPLGKNIKSLSLKLPCSPCFKRECPKKHLRCMRDLLPKLILDAIHKLLI